MQFFFLLPNRSLPYLKIVQGERNKKKNCIFLFIALALHYLCIYKNRSYAINRTIWWFGQTVVATEQ